MADGSSVSAVVVVFRVPTHFPLQSPVESNTPPETLTPDGDDDPIHGVIFRHGRIFRPTTWRASKRHSSPQLPHVYPFMRRQSLEHKAA